MSTRPRTILISGASSGIGRALALNYAKEGTRLALIGRNAQRLDDVSARCRDAGAEVTAAQLDVRKRAELADWIRAIDDRNPIDLVVANAGVAGGLGNGRWREDPDKVRAIMAINLEGVLNTIDPLVERMGERRAGHIALIGSLGGIRGAPFVPAYSAAKAAIHVYAEALRAGLAARGVAVTLVVPGFVATPIFNGVKSPKRRFEMSDVRAAAIIRRGLDRRARVVAFPRLLYFGTHLLRILPIGLVDRWFNTLQVQVPETRESPFDD